MSKHNKNDNAAARKEKSISTGVSVMQAMSNLDSSTGLQERALRQTQSTATAVTTYTSSQYAPEDLLLKLGRNEPAQKALAKTNASRSRSRSTTRAGSSREERKQSIREARARSRSRSHSQTPVERRRSGSRRRTERNRTSDSASVGSTTVSSTAAIRGRPVQRRSTPAATPQTITTTTPQKAAPSSQKRATQQLILLRYAARCPYGPDSTDRACRGVCPIHKHCRGAKELLDHLTHCPLAAQGGEGCSYRGCNPTNHGFLQTIQGTSSGTPKNAAASSPTSKTSRRKCVPKMTAEEVDGDINDLMEEAEVATGMTPKIQKSSTTMVSRSPTMSEQPTDPLNRQLVDHGQQTRVAISRAKKEEALSSSKLGISFLKAKFRQATGLAADPTSLPTEVSVIVNHDDVELGADASMMDSEVTAYDDYALEQQSLLQEEIHRRRVSRAPKSATKTTTITTSGSVTGTTSVVSVGQEIKRRAEGILQKMKDTGKKSVTFGGTDNISSTTTHISSRSGSGSSGIFRRQGKWAFMARYCCILSGFMFLLSIIALVLIYVFSSDDWNTLTGPLVDTMESTSQKEMGPGGTGSVSINDRPPRVPTGPPVRPWNPDHSPTPVPTQFIEGLPDYTRDVLQKDRINSVAENGVISGDVVESPQTMAYRWVLEEHTQMAHNLDVSGGVTFEEEVERGAWFSPEEWRKRFALATFYYATTLSKKKMMEGRNSVEKITNWTKSDQWLDVGVSVCDWSFYSCDRKDSLWIAENGLRGSLPAEMGMMTDVRDLAVINNQYLTGPLPTQLGFLTNTVSVNLQGNNLGGGIPPELGNMKKLRWLYLNDNNLSSTIPLELGNLSRLAYLWLNDNMISGPINPGLFANKGFKYLQELLLHNTLISGTIPDEIGSMPRARFISLYKTKLTGTIPSTLGLLTDLEGIKLHQTGLTGSVPAELCQLVERGTLKTITIDCDNISCDCDCSCISEDSENFESDLPQKSNMIPATAVLETVGIENKTQILDLDATSTPTEFPTRAPHTSAHSYEITRPPVTPMPTIEPTIFVETSFPTLTPITSVPTAKPTSAHQPEVSAGAVTGAAEFMLQLPEFTKEALLNPESPQSLALLWFQADPGGAKYSFRKQLQRFAMATLFYSTNGDEWFQSDGFLDYDTDECDWFTTFQNGDTCKVDPDNGERIITDLMQWGNNLFGPVPPEIALLTSLKTIFLGINNVTEIPTEIGLLSDTLEVMNFMHCALEGPVPTELGLLTNLRKMDLSENYYEGTIPAELGNLHLENLYLNHNYLEGTIPPELFNVASLKGMNVAANALTGTLPTEIGNIGSAQWLNLYGNWIAGPIPSEMGRLHKLVALHTSHNLMTGTIPTELALLDESHSLSLDFRYNDLRGAVPSELGDLTNLIVLAIEGNAQLSGDIPGSICQLMDNWKLNTLSIDCASLSCDSDACGGSAGGYCMCPVLEAFDDDFGNSE